ncbi:hypothetical protein [Staphylothermus marinus]|uniref:hypothetical protein n=1 Tax=Staphylothermus marinus TaxID=2280 RepID=UPI00146F253C|nr:hypothetical protein [Staphylothermus marinus]
MMLYILTINLLLFKAFTMLMILIISNHYEIGYDPGTDKITTWTFHSGYKVTIWYIKL